MAKPESAGWSIAHACQALRLCFILAEGLGKTASLRLIEANVCRNYYRKHDPSVIDVDNSVAEALCKAATVQQAVVQVNGLLNGLSSLPALLAALPFLALHRLLKLKNLLLLNMFGILLENVYFSAVLYFYNVFDPRAAAFYGFFSFVGGGYPVADSVLRAKIAESVPQSLLSTFQLHYTAASLLVKIIGTSLGLSLMKKSAWFPMVLMLFVHCSTVVIVYIFFDNEAPQHSSSQSTAYHVLNDEEPSPTSRNDLMIGVEDSVLSQPGIALIWKSIKQCHKIIITSLLPIAVVLLYELGDSFRLTMPYWMSRRYHWELREVGWVQLAQTLWTACIVALLPIFAKKFLGDRKPSREGLRANLVSTSDSQQQHSDSSDDDNYGNVNSPNPSTSTAQPDAASARRDLRLTKICVLLSSLGTLLIGMSWHRISIIVSLMIQSGGYGFADAYYSFLAFHVSSHKHYNAADTGERNKSEAISDIATVYMVLSLVTMMAWNLGGWLLSLIDAVGLAFGGENGDGNSATSLPPWFSAIIFLAAWWTARQFKID